MKNNDNAMYGLNLFAGIFTAIQTEHAFQIASLVLTCVATLLSICFTVWKWWKKAYADKKITSEELEELEKQLEGKEKELQDKIKGENKE